MTFHRPRNRPWLAIRHAEHEHLGTLATAFEHAGQEFHYLNVYRGDAVPADLTGWGGLVVMGGAMGVYEADQFPFLAEEMKLIRKAAETSFPVLGICLGSQLIAGALGARVYPGPEKEIGWYSVEVAAPGEDLARDLAPSFMGFHWHGDTFELPSGAVHLFRSRRYENQGFRWGEKVFGLQFHLEVSAPMVDEWLQDPGCRAEIAAVPGLEPETIHQQAQEHSAALMRVSALVFGNFFRIVAGG
jgi:GMP synthase (glutamine-hydrolysing)